MALNLPFSANEFANLMPVQSFRWELQLFRETSGTAIGDVIVRQIAAPKWRAQATMRPMLKTEADKLTALFDSVQVANSTFYLYDLLKCHPGSDLTGTELGGATPQVHGVSAKALRISGLPSGYRLRPGDMVSVSYGGTNARRSLHRICEIATSQPTGVTEAFDVVPYPKEGVSEGDPVDLKKPTAKMMLSSFDPGNKEGRMIVGMSFTAIEAY